MGGPPRALDGVAPGVLVATAVTYATTSTVLVSDDGTCLVVDPALTPAEVAGLAAAVRAEGPVAGGFSTHPHWDHVLWSQDLGDVPRWATPTAARTAAREHAALVEAAGTAPGHDEELIGRLTSWGGDRLPWTREVVVVEHGAHAPGSAALVVPDARVLVVGDVLSDREVPLLDLDDGDPLGAYVRGLDHLAAAIDRYDVAVLVPGHGTVATGAEVRRRLAADRVYLDTLADGRPVDDPRLDDPWLRAEHDRQVTALASR